MYRRTSIMNVGLLMQFLTIVCASSAMGQDEFLYERKGLLGKVNAVTTQRFTRQQRTEEWVEERSGAFPQWSRYCFDSRRSFPCRPGGGGYTTESESGTFEYSYDADHRLTQMVVQSDKGELRRMKTYSYNGDGNLYSEELYLGDGKLDRQIIYTYAGRRLVGKAVYLASGVVGVEHAYNYDERGALITEKVKDAHGGEMVYEYAYNYDSRGNWTRRVKSEKVEEGSVRMTEPEEALEREIEYR